MTLPDEMTIGECYGPAMSIETQKEADEYLEALVERHMRITGESRVRAEQVEKSNLGYFAGYCSSETRERVERLFRCSHPIFGAIASCGEPTFDQALNEGLRIAGGWRSVETWR